MTHHGAEYITSYFVQKRVHKARRTQFCERIHTSIVHVPIISRVYKIASKGLIAYNYELCSRNVLRAVMCIFLITSRKGKKHAHVSVFDEKFEHGKPNNVFTNG